MRILPNCREVITPFITTHFPDWMEWGSGGRGSTSRRMRLAPFWPRDFGSMTSHERPGTARGSLTSWMRYDLP
jgi:hypothetical protein